MRFYFTKNRLIGSKAIMWGLGEDCSHMAIGFEDRGIVIESRLDHGVGEDSEDAFRARNTIVHQLTLKSSHLPFENELRQSLNKGLGKRYDGGAMVFWTLAALGKKLLGRPLPHKNPWGKRGEHYCVEIIRGSEAILDAHLGTDFGKRDVEMISPFQAYKILAASPKLW